MRARVAHMWIALTSDKRKAGVLAGLVIVAFALGLRALVVSRSGASARHGVTPATATSGTKRGAPSGAGEDVRKPEAARVVRLPALDGLTRNIFLPDPDVFPLSPQTDGTGGEAAKSRTGNDDTSFDLERTQRERAQRVRDEAGRLRLRSTIVGGTPLVVIERTTGAKGAGVVLRLGQEIDGFTLLEVRSDRAILQKEGVRVELELPRP